MANHCYNEIAIEAPPRIIQMLAEAIEDGKNLIEILAPNEVRAVNVYSHTILTDNEIHISAESKWRPPLEALKAASDTFPEIRKVECMYSELGNGIFGYYHSDIGDTRFDAPRTRDSLDTFKAVYPIMAEFAEAEIGCILEDEEEEER